MTNRSVAAAAVMAAAALTAVVLWACWPKAAEPKASAGSPGLTQAPGPEPSEPVEASVPAAKAPPPKAEPAAVQYPDGSKAPPLNGVTESVKLNWSQRPFSPIKSKVVGNGLEWYVHEDGSHSTVWYTEVNGVRQAAGMVAEPTQVLPTSADLEKQMQPALQRR